MKGDYKQDRTFSKEKKKKTQTNLFLNCNASEKKSCIFMNKLSKSVWRSLPYGEGRGKIYCSWLTRSHGRENKSCYKELLLWFLFLIYEMNWLWNKARNNSHIPQSKRVTKWKSSPIFIRLFKLYTCSPLGFVCSSKRAQLQNSPRIAFSFDSFILAAIKH